MSGEGGLPACFGGLIESLGEHPAGGRLETEAIIKEDLALAEQRTVAGWHWMTESWVGNAAGDAALAPGTF